MKFKVYEQIGNFSEMVFESNDFYEVQEYLTDRFKKSGYDDETLFYSLFDIEEE